MKTEHSLRELGEALIEAHEATQKGYGLSTYDLICVAKEIMQYADYKIDSYSHIDDDRRL